MLAKDCFNSHIGKFNMFVVFNFALLICLSTIQAAPVETNSKATPYRPEICPAQSLCGWAFYIPSSKKVDFYIGNRCICAPDKVCLRAEDNELLGAIVYRCENKPSPSTTETPTTTKQISSS